MERDSKAYSKLGSMQWVGEQVDYASEIRRLVTLAGVSDEAIERIVRLTFITGILNHISINL